MGSKAARKLMRSLLKKQEIVPILIVTDKLRSYRTAFREMRITAQHIDNKRANNRAEIPISQCEDENERCSVLNPPAPPNASSTSTPLPTITSTTNVILLTETCSKKLRADAFADWKVATTAV
ncbi:DDE-type integrase/transposase/recombinase [Sphingorhabdus sp. 109]|uniref:DDE-type integrase/transposase/recombinase n=1 Tax=Sphingorhabdus sp. 109 TaxID=2653173 RepID=UPI0022A6C4AC|nr:DDE-type integrase/transposase/recombinase [Sphingorhabdus sp. 109]